MPVAEPSWRRAGRKVDSGLIGEQRGDRIEHRDIDRLAASRALACKQRRGNRLGREHPRHDVGDRYAQSVWRPVAAAGNTHQSAFALHDCVIPGLAPARTGMAEPGDRAVDKPRMRSLNRRIVEAELGQRAWPEVFDEHVGARDEPIERGSALRLLEVERHALLVAVDAHEVRALARLERRTPAACIVALAGLFDLDDPCPEVGEKHRAVRPGEHPGEVEDGDTLKGRHMANESGSIVVFAGSA